MRWVVCVCARERRCRYDVVRKTTGDKRILIYEQCQRTWFNNREWAIDNTKLETWDAHRAKSLCYGRRKAQTTNKQSKQYLELKKGMDAVSTTDNFEQAVREDPTE